MENQKLEEKLYIYFLQEINRSVNTKNPNTEFHNTLTIRHHIFQTKNIPTFCCRDEKCNVNYINMTSLSKILEVDAKKPTKHSDHTNRIYRAFNKKHREKMKNMMENSPLQLVVPVN